VEDRLLGVTKCPHGNGETTIDLYDAGSGETDTGSAGIQYVVRDAAMVEAKRVTPDIRVLTPLNKVRGFDLITVFLADPDGVTNYFPRRAKQPHSAAGTERALARHAPAPIVRASALLARSDVYRGFSESAGPARPSQE